MSTPKTPLTEFCAWPKIPRRDKLGPMCITEKIDGTNAQVIVHEDGRVQAGSRTRFITPEDDNFGFAQWVAEHEEELRLLGTGRHYGEWWGLGIQRGYDMTERAFSTFNTWRPADTLPPCVRQVPILYKGEIQMDEVRCAMGLLASTGSLAAPGFTKPEGIIIYVAGQLIKETFERKAA